ncbi:MAG: hypothetical protein AABZ80_12690 [Gemmatimonadota bacterium]
MNVILVGTDAALLEGLAQSYASNGFSPHVVPTLLEACEVASESAPIVAVVARDLAIASAGDAAAIQLAPGGSLVLYHGGDPVAAIPAMLQRSVVAELVLPLERSRLVALTRSLAGRADVVGRTKDREIENRKSETERPDIGLL